MASIIPRRRTRVWRNDGPMGSRADEGAGNRNGDPAVEGAPVALNTQTVVAVGEAGGQGPQTAHDAGNGRRPQAPTISVIIPAINEAMNLPHVLGALPAHVSEVVLVDGYSTDETTEVARQHYPDIRIVSQTRKGKGNALSCGFQAARGDVIVMLDADGSADPAEIDRFVEVLKNGVDFAKGSRFLAGGGSSDLTRIRRLGNAVLVGIVNVLYRTGYTDLCYGYNAFWADCLPYFDLDCDGFEVEALMNIRAAKTRLCVREVPSFESGRLYGESNLRAVRDGLRILRTIIREFARTSKESQPVPASV